MGDIIMKIKLLTMSCISGLSLAMLAGCSDSNPAIGDFYNAGEGITSSDSQTGTETGATEKEARRYALSQMAVDMEKNRVAAE